MNISLLRNNACLLNLAAYEVETPMGAIEILFTMHQPCLCHLGTFPIELPVQIARSAKQNSPRCNFARLSQSKLTSTMSNRTPHHPCLVELLLPDQMLNNCPPDVPSSMAKTLKPSGQLRVASLNVIAPFGPDGRIESSARLKNRRSDRHIRPPDAICRDRLRFPGRLRYCIGSPLVCPTRPVRRSYLPTRDNRATEN